MTSGFATPKSGCILVYGSDKLLLDTRTMVLEHAGFCVCSAVRFADAEIILETNSIDLLVLCHSLSSRQCELALEFARHHEPVILTLVLTAGALPVPDGMSTAVLSAFDGPGRLVDTVQQLLSALGPTS